MLQRVRARMRLLQVAHTLHIPLKVTRSQTLQVPRLRHRLPRTVLPLVPPLLLVVLRRRAQRHHNSPSYLHKLSQARRHSPVRHIPLSMLRLTL